MLAHFTLIVLAVMCLFSAGFAGGVAWAFRDEMRGRECACASGLLLFLGVICFIAGASA